MPFLALLIFFLVVLSIGPRAIPGRPIAFLALSDNVLPGLHPSGKAAPLEILVQLVPLVIQTRLATRFDIAFRFFGSLKVFLSISARLMRISSGCGPLFLPFCAMLILRLVSLLTAWPFIEALLFIRVSSLQGLPFPASLIFLQVSSDRLLPRLAALILCLVSSV